MRIVCDTNVIVSGLLFGGPPNRVLRLIASDRLVNYTSTPMFRELDAVLRRPKFGLTTAEVAQMLRVFSTSFEFVAPSEALQVITQDPADDRVLETALAVNADAIVSGDRDLLDLDSFRGIPIRTPADFLGSQ